MTEALDIAVDRELMKRSFHEFLKGAFPVMEGGAQLVDNWHLQHICGILQNEVERIGEGSEKEGDWIINIPPRSLKSITLMALTAWAWIRFPEMGFITASYSKSLSMDHNVKSRRLMESQWFGDRWGDSFELLQDGNTKTEFENNHSGARIATSVGGTLTGKGADIFIIDDPIKPLEAESELKRNEVIEWWKSTASTRLNDPKTGVFIVVMQRVHTEDLVGYLEKEEDSLNKLTIPAEAGPKVHPPELIENYVNGSFFPERFPLDILKDLTKRLGARAYSAQYDQDPVKKGGNLMKGAWFEIVKPEDVPPGTVNFYSDTAYTKKVTNDPSVILAYTVNAGILYILSVSVVWKEFPEFKKHFARWILANGYSGKSRVHVEAKATGKPVIDELKGKLNVIGENVSDSKVERVVAQTAKMESGVVKLVAGAWNDGFISECEAFPDGKHDDQVDCLTGAMRMGLKTVSWTKYL